MTQTIGELLEKGGLLEEVLVPITWPLLRFISGKETSFKGTLRS